MKVPSGNKLLNPLKILKEELQIKTGDHLADLGCGGVGYFSLQAAKLIGENGLVYAVDILKSALSSINNRAKMENLANIKTLWSDLEKFGALEIHDQSLDAALLINILFQNKNKETILKEAIRLIKPQGKLLIIDWAPGRFSIGPGPDEKVDLEKIKNLTISLGLTEIKSFQPGKYHFGIIFQKL